MPSPAHFALALNAIDGVGRVTINKLLSHFPTYDDLTRYPREQVLTRLKGVRQASDLVNTLFSDEAMAPYFDHANTELDELRPKRVQVLVPSEHLWPSGLSDLPVNQRPPYLYSYGPAPTLHLPKTALFASPPLVDDSFELSQTLVRLLLNYKTVPVTSAWSGFDVVVGKLSDGASLPSVLVADRGMMHVVPTLRPTVSLAVRNRGVLISPFPMNHGPFDHDARERALVMAAIAQANVFLDPAPKSPEWKAMAWSMEAGRPTFAIAAPTAELPPAVHRLNGEADLEWVLLALGLSDEA
ncbi:MAG: DNA-processing protein DprA [Bacteroidota bacterium]